MARFYRALCCGVFALSSGLLAAQPSQPAFRLLPSSKSGITWTHTAGKSAMKYLPESSGAGAAILDFDNDGWPDIYLVNSGKADFYTPAKPIRNALYRNNHDDTFTDVTEKAGVQGGGYAMGVAVGDYDNDGYSDLYVTQYERNILYHNNGDGTFTDVTQKAGVATAGWSTSAVWFDYDNDGRLDLYVGQFAHLNLQTGCGVSVDGRRRYCIPTIFEPRSGWLFHNNGDGTFTDVSKKAGIAIPGKTWGVVATDIDNDGLMDLFVTNDTVPNFLFHNRGDGTFEEIALAADVAYSMEGKARSGMGVDSADFDEDGWMDLFVGNIDEEIFSIYRNLHDKRFEDRAMTAGIGLATRWLSGWGFKFADVDNDGLVDVIGGSGYPDDTVDEAGTEVTYEQPLKIFQNNGASFVDVSAAAGKAFANKYAARGLAIGDLNNDGKVDALFCLNDGAPLLLMNETKSNNHWLGLRLVGKTVNRDAIGARVQYQAGGKVHHRMVVGGGSFLSSSDPRLVLGAGKQNKIDWLEVRWPGAPGKVEKFTNLPIDRYVTITEGAGKWQ
jgi:enediyne biosynthesis protein E4